MKLQTDWPSAFRVKCERDFYYRQGLAKSNFLETLGYLGCQAEHYLYSNSDEMADGAGVRPAKRVKLLDDDEDNDTAHPRRSPNAQLSINEDYAKRFAHNKKRDELSRRTFLP